MTATEPTTRLAEVGAILRCAADRLHLASLRQVECPAELPCVDEDALIATLIAVAATCGPCHSTLVVVDIEEN